MSLIELQRRTSSQGVNRIFYEDSATGQLVERIIHNHGDYEPVFEENRNAEARPGANVRKVASIPVDIFEKWLKEENMPGYCGPEEMDMLINKKLRDPQYAYLRSVPTSYRMKKYGSV